MEIITLNNGGAEHQHGDGHLKGQEQRDIVLLHQDDEEDGEEEQEERNRPDSSLLPHPAAPMDNYDVLDEPGASKSAIIGEASVQCVYVCVWGACRLVKV